MSRDVGGSNLDNKFAISNRVLSVTSWPIIYPSFFTPIKTVPLLPFKNAQTVSNALCNFAVDVLNSKSEDSPCFASISMSFKISFP